MPGRQNKGSGRITIRDVAEDAGVSFAAVSKVLRNAYGVSDALRQRVEASIKKLGYRPNMAARGLRGKTNAVGILLLDLANPFLPAVIDGINDAAEEMGYKTMIGVSRASVAMEGSLIDSMIDYQMDGLLLIAPRLPASTLEWLASQLPIVVIGQHFPDSTSFDTVNADDRMGARQVVEGFVASGYRSIGMMSVNDADQTKSNAANLREQGYRQAMQAAGLADNIDIVRMPDDPHASEAQIERYLMNVNRPEAVFCWSDLHAIPTINIAYRLGIPIPESLAIAGFDNSPVAAMPKMGLASIDQDAGNLGSTAGKLLFSRIEGRAEAQHLHIPTRLVRRPSLRPLPTAKPYI